jgi:hypothetical protein
MATSNANELEKSRTFKWLKSLPKKKTLIEWSDIGKHTKKTIEGPWVDVHVHVKNGVAIFFTVLSGLDEDEEEDFEDFLLLPEIKATEVGRPCSWKISTINKTLQYRVQKYLKRNDIKFKHITWEEFMIGSKVC